MPAQRIRVCVCVCVCGEMSEPKINGANGVTGLFRGAWGVRHRSETIRSGSATGGRYLYIIEMGNVFIKNYENVDQHTDQMGAGVMSVLFLTHGA